MEKLFRDEAVENYKSKFSLNKNISRLPVHTVVLGFIFIIGILFMLTWFAYGKVTISVEADGIVFPSDGFEDIVATDYGTINYMTINIGDKVYPGDIIAVIPDEDTIEQIEYTKEHDPQNEESLKELYQRYKKNSIIIAEASGTVVSKANEGDSVMKGDNIARIAVEKKNNNKGQILAFIPTDNMYSIKLGSQVQISPNYAPREKHGYINGYVSYIGTEILTNKSLGKAYDVYNISDLLEEGKTYFPVYINMLSDENEEGKLVWSLKRSRDIPVGLGTQCSASIVIDQKSPFEWLFGGVK
ncbi:MAG: hypothetical protein IJ583_05185 [Firmicutes bacterium]|nr:hypothetical protein [Bacillota bacterium]